MPDVFLLVDWDDRSDNVVAACSTLERAQQAYLDLAYPVSGPRGGRRPPQPVVTWSASMHDADHWTPSDHDDGRWCGFYIERHQVDSAAPQPGDSDGEATT